jgi:hypothetical protein
VSGGTHRDVRHAGQGQRLQTVLLVLLCVELTLAMVLGGASRDEPLQLMVVELGALPVLLAAVLIPKRKGFWRENWPALTILLAMLGVPLLQLTPLPPQVWTSFDSHRVAAETLRVAGVSPGWRPFSLTPDATAQAFLWLLPGVSLFLGTLALDHRRRMVAVIWLLGLIAISLVLAGLQLSNPESGLFDLRGQTSLPRGLFANRNHQAMALVVAMPLSAAVISWWSRRRPEAILVHSVLFAGVSGTLMAGVLLTQSRAGLVLASAAVVASLLVFAFSRDGGRLRRHLGYVGTSVLVVVGAIFAVGAAAAIGRWKGLAGDARFETWPLIWDTAAASQPFGTGLGSFVSVFRSVEPAEMVDPTFVNAAHNDYLQLWLEAGMLFPLLFLGFLAWLCISLYRLVANGGEGSILGRAAGVAIVLLLLHSTVDYPLRTEALAGIFGLLCGCLRPERTPSKVGRRGSAAPSKPSRPRS